MLLHNSLTRPRIYKHTSCEFASIINSFNVDSYYYTLYYSLSGKHTQCKFGYQTANIVQLHQVSFISLGQLDGNDNCFEKLFGDEAKISKHKINHFHYCNKREVCATAKILRYLKPTLALGATLSALTVKQINKTNQIQSKADRVDFYEPEAAKYYLRCVASASQMKGQTNLWLCRWQLAPCPMSFNKCFTTALVNMFLLSGVPKQRHLGIIFLAGGHFDFSNFVSIKAETSPSM